MRVFWAPIEIDTLMTMILCFLSLYLADEVLDDVHLRASTYNSKPYNHLAYTLKAIQANLRDDAP